MNYLKTYCNLIRKAEQRGYTKKKAKEHGLVLKLRANAKSTKDFATADLIREELKKLNIQIKDNRDGSSWEFND